MQKDKLTFNDLPEVVGELCERISSMENLLTEKLHQQHNEVKKDTHVPMTVDEVCEYLGISKSSFYYKAKHGGIPIIKQGKHLFVYRDELRQKRRIAYKHRRRTRPNACNYTSQSQS